MNRNISMLILLAIVVGTILIGYNKWIMRDAYTISGNASSQMAVNVGTQESQALQEAGIEKSTSDTLVSAVSEASSTTSPVVKAKTSPSLQAPSVDSPQVDSGKVLTLVTKTITVADVRPETGVKTSPSVVAVTPQKKSAVKKSAELSPLGSVSYADEKLTVSASNKFTYKIFGLKEPDRFVVDIVGRFSEDLPEPKVAQDSLVKAVRLGRHEDRVRIVLDLKGKLPPNWSATQNSSTLSVMMK